MAAQLETCFGRRTNSDQGEATAPPSVYWYLSFRCNLTCAHCWIGSSPWAAASADLSTERAFAVIEQMAALKARTVILSGGEPFLRPDATVLIDALVRAGVNVAIETNGTLIRPRVVEAIQPHYARGMLSLVVSVDGGSAESHERLRGPGTFNRALRGIELLKEAGVGFGVQTVLNRANLVSLAELFALAKGWAPHLNHLRFAVLNPVGRGENLCTTEGLTHEELTHALKMIVGEADHLTTQVDIKVAPGAIPPALLMRISKHPRLGLTFGCNFPVLGVLPDGSITLCALSRAEDELTFGNVSSHRLEDVWSAGELQEIRRRYQSGESLAGVCGDCVWRTRCKGGCRVWAYREQGSLDGANPICASLDRLGQFPSAYRVSRNGDAFAREVAATQRS
jgi:Fe-coproporphyrin III synthase